MSYRIGSFIPDNPYNGERLKNDISINRKEARKNLEKAKKYFHKQNKARENCWRAVYKEKNSFRRFGTAMQWVSVVFFWVSVPFWIGYRPGLKLTYGIMFFCIALSIVCKCLADSKWNIKRSKKIEDKIKVQYKVAEINKATKAYDDMCHQYWNGFIDRAIASVGQEDILSLDKIVPPIFFWGYDDDGDFYRDTYEREYYYRFTTKEYDITIDSETYYYFGDKGMSHSRGRYIYDDDFFFRGINFTQTAVMCCNKHIYVYAELYTIGSENVDIRLYDIPFNNIISMQVYGNRNNASLVIELKDPVSLNIDCIRFPIVDFESLDKYLDLYIKKFSVYFEINKLILEFDASQARDEKEYDKVEDVPRYIELKSEIDKNPLNW